jgi:hypothetical protein
MIALNILNFNSPFGSSLSGFHVAMFIIGSFTVISILLLYCSKIPKSNNLITELDNPIYQTKDILFQSNSANTNFIIAQKTTSVFVKVCVYIAIFIFVVFPLDII